MSVYLMRHGCTQMNFEGRIQGTIEALLCDLGREQSRITAEFLKEKKIAFSRVLTSPLKRAVQTASIVSGFSEEDVEKKDFLREMSFGIFEGQILRKLSDEDKRAVFAYPFEENEKYEMEPYDSVRKRVHEIIKYLGGIDNTSENILVVSHGGMVRAVLSELYNTPLQDFWSVYEVPNCKIYRLDLKEKQAEEFFQGIKLPPKEEREKKK